MMYYMSFCSNESCSKGICPLFNVTDVGVGFFCGGGGWMDGRHRLRRRRHLMSLLGIT